MIGTEANTIDICNILALFGLMLMVQILNVQRLFAAVAKYGKVEIQDLRRGNRVEGSWAHDWRVANRKSRVLKCDFERRELFKT